MEEKNKIEEQLNSIREHSENGEILFMTEEGVVVSKIEDIIKQPIEGLLYDLNRDSGTLTTMAKSSKSMRWVNDMALVNVLKYVIKENEDLKITKENLLSELKRLTIKLEETNAELASVKLEYRQFAKNPYNDKYQYDTTPIPTASKPSVEKTNQNASTIMPGFNDQLNICL